MSNSFRTDARTGITAEVIICPGGGGDEIHAWVARLAKVRADGDVSDGQRGSRLRGRARLAEGPADQQR
jgi:hypothetical protein